MSVRSRDAQSDSGSIENVAAPGGRSRRLRSPTPAPEPARLAEEWDLSQSVGMRRVRDVVERVAPTDATVLVWGESGVGKELVARALHGCSPRRHHAFVKVNCAALPLELLESELFGYERGAFTGAHRQKPGKFELAHAGTIFLDEIGEMPLPLQAKLLQVLQDRQFSRLGSRHDVRVDVRVVAATNQDLGQLALSARFREDLFHRLNVVTILVPPLRERPQEIAILTDHFARRYCAQYGRPYRAVGAATLTCFLEYPWPGNVRELENAIKRIVLLESEAWVPDELVPSVKSELRARVSPLPGGTMVPPAPSGTAAPPAPAPTPPHSNGRLTYEGDGLKAVARRAALEAERAVLKAVLDQVHWNRLEASRRLKISYKTMRYKIRQCGLED
jgi:two-component system response regulator AtoC